MTHILSIFFSDEVGVFVHFCCHSQVASDFKSFYNWAPLPSLVEYPCFKDIIKDLLSLSCAVLTVCLESVLRSSLNGFLLGLDGDFTITSTLSSFSSARLVSVGEGHLLLAGVLTESLLDDFLPGNFLLKFCHNFFSGFAP